MHVFQFLILFGGIQFQNCVGLDLNEDIDLGYPRFHVFLSPQSKHAPLVFRKLELQDIGMPSVPLVFGIVPWFIPLPRNLFAWETTLLVLGLFLCLETCLHGKSLSWSQDYSFAQKLVCMGDHTLGLRNVSLKLDKACLILLWDKSTLSCMSHIHTLHMAGPTLESSWIPHAIILFVLDFYAITLLCYLVLESLINCILNPTF